MNKPAWVPPEAFDVYVRYAGNAEIMSGSYAVCDSEPEKAIKLPIIEKLIFDDSMRETWETVVAEATAIRNGRRVLSHPMIDTPGEAYAFLLQHTADAYCFFLSEPKSARSDVRETLKEVADLAKKLSMKLETPVAQHYLNRYVGASKVFGDLEDSDLWYRLLQTKVETKDILAQLSFDATNASQQDHGLSRPNAKNAHRSYVARSISVNYFQRTFGEPHHNLVATILNVIFPDATPAATGELIRQFLLAS
jgi:hypothetical protein